MSDEKKEVEKFDFFISLKFDPGKPWAEWIAWTLEEFGYWVFFAPWDIGPAENIPHILDEALIHSHHIVLIVSKEYFDSDAGKAEWYSFMHQDYLGKKESIVPIRTAKFKREGFIGPINYVDLVDKTRGEAKDILKKAARRLRRNAPKRLNSGSGFVWERRKYRDKPESEPPFPGDKTESDQTSPSSKVIWNRPNPNPNFTGRRGLLEQLRAKFLGSPTHKIAVEPSQAISGNGGIGKTELAKEYTHIYEAEYDLIAWIHAEEEKKRHQELRDLAVALGLVNEGMEPTEAKKILYEHLNGRSNWLLVFDNVATPAEMKSDLNALKNGHVLMTSRDRHWIGLAESFSLGQFAPDESLDYLKKLLPEEPEEH
ncbi:TIR domain-containing protein, partial [bacterium]|nr:TIR domain-containing protein [bacterium]